LWARSQESAENALRFFSVVSCDAVETARGSDICVLCTPIGAMAPLVEQFAPALSGTAIVTDVGSVKAGVVSRLEALLGGRFVGSHPMAGSEQSGINAARANLFEGAVCILTPTENSPGEHDERVARVSHLPHAVAAALVHAISLRLSDVSSIAGGGYRDTTRIAAGPAPMWREILLENRAGLLAGLEDFSAMLDKMKDLILKGDAAQLELFLERARAIREDLP
jgi:prephenate dehydrogenase